MRDLEIPIKMTDMRFSRLIQLFRQKSLNIVAIIA